MAQCATTSRMPLAAFRQALTVARSLQDKVTRRGSPASRLPPSAFRLPSNQVDDREQHDPHEIDEVPVEAERLDPLVVRLRVLAEQALPVTKAMQTTPQKTWNPWNPVVVKKTEPKS